MTKQNDKAKTNERAREREKHTLRGQLTGKFPSEMVNSGLAGVVDECGDGLGTDTGDRTNVDNTSRVCLGGGGAEERQNGLGKEEHSLDVEIHDFVPTSLVVSFNRGAPRRTAGRGEKTNCVSWIGNIDNDSHNLLHFKQSNGNLPA